MLNYEKVIFEMVKKCADCGAHDAQKMANAGIFEPLYLYLKPSSETENGVLKLISDSETAPDGFELVTGEGLRGNVPFSEYFSWVRARVNRLPILAYGVAGSIAYYNAGHPKGTICVLRQIAGTWVALALPVTAWREYNGAFSIWRA